METKRIILYPSSLYEVQQIDSRELGELIKKELAWVAGKTDEPVFDDIRCDIFHHRLQEQQDIRNKWAKDRQNRRTAKQEPSKPSQTEKKETYIDWSGKEKEKEDF